MKIKFALVAILLVASAAAPAIATPLQDAGNAYARGDFATALQIWKPLAEQGDVVAQKNLARLHEAGRGVPANAVEAVWWYRKAADQGNAFARFKLGVMYYTGGAGVVQDYEQSLKWFKLISGPSSVPTATAAENGNTVARFLIGLMYLNGNGVPQDFAEAAKWLTVVMYFGPKDTMGDVGRLFKDEYGTTSPDSGQIFQEYNKALSANYYVAAQALGFMYLNGKGVSRDIAKAIQNFLISANNGDARSQFELGKIYNGIDQSPVKEKARAYFFFDLAAAQGYTGASEARDTLSSSMTNLDRQFADNYRDTWRRKQGQR